MTIESSLNQPKTEVFNDDILDAVCLCHAGLAQDSPHPATHYLNQVMGLLFAYLNKEERYQVEEFLAQKKYLPPVDIQIAKWKTMTSSI